MARRSLVSFTLLAMEFQGAYCSPIVEKFSRVNCISEMNAAREKVGFAPVTAQNPYVLPMDTSDQEQFVNFICTKMRQGGLSSRDSIFNDLTFALAPQSGDEPDCAEAVQYWESGFASFDGLPPRLSRKSDVEYEDTKKVSFIFLYNPGADQSVECGFVTCRASPPISDGAGTGLQPPQGLPESTNLGGGGSAKDTLHGLLCQTSPGVLLDSRAPFDEAQWKKITNALAGINNYASTALPTFLALAAAALGIALF